MLLPETTTRPFERVASRFCLRNSCETNCWQIQTAIEIGARLVSTRYWEYASSLIAATGRPRALDVYHRDLLRYTAAEQALRCRDFQGAWTLANGNGPHGWRTTLTLRGELVAAAAAQGLGYGREARNLIDSIISAAESVNATPILRDAYRLAGEITGERKFTSKAGEVGRLLTA